MTETSENVAGEIRLTIHLPACIEAGVDFVESVHNRLDSLAEVKEVLAGTSQLNQVTNYDLEYEGQKITEQFDDVTSLDEIFAPNVSEANIRLIERAYNLKSVYEHLNRFREKIGLNFFDYANKSLGVGLGYSRLNYVGLKDIDTKKPDSEEGDGKKKSAEEGEKAEEESFSISETESAFLKEKILAVSSASHAFLDDALSVLSKWALPIKSLTVNQWNPVPQPQKLKGDLLYLTLSTLENETFAITCHASGFYVNRLSGAVFNPAIKVNDKGVSRKHYILYNLIASLSPKVSSTLESNKTALYEASQFTESYLIPSQALCRFPWAVPEKSLQEQTIPDFSRSQFPIFAYGTDGADLVKDWNDEYQAIKDFPRDSFSERLLRDKLLNKYIQEFNQTATATAIDIVKGNLTPLNPNEETKKHIYLRNNIFYSFGINATGSHDSTGGDEAARYCFGKDLSSIKILNRFDSDGARTLLSCVVDFLGERVICQAPVPGIFSEQLDLNGEPIEKVSYGYSQEKSEIKLDSGMANSIKHIAETFHLKSHSLELASGSSTPNGSELVVSKDTKGIKGNDGRNYVIDLYRTTPIDIGFLEKHYEEGSETSYPHKEASMRHELIEEWFKRKSAAIFKAKTEELEENGTSETHNDEKPQIAIPYDEIVFNPDTFLGVNDSEEDKATVREICSLVVKHIIPECLDDVSRNSVPVDGAQLTEYFHKAGINMRYLGHIAFEIVKFIEEHKASVEKQVAANEERIAALKKEEERKKEAKKTEADEKKEEEEENKEEATSSAKLYPVIANLEALHTLVVQEMIVRGIKHTLRTEGLKVPLLLKLAFVSYFHNCLLGTDVNACPEAIVDPDLKGLFSKEEIQFTDLTSEKLKKLIEKEVFVRFRYTLPNTWFETMKKPQVLREVAIKFGIQWKAQNYLFDLVEFEAAYKPVEPAQEQVAVKGKKKKSTKAGAAPVARSTTFVPDDIVAFVPVVKDSSYRCALVDEVFETAKQQFQLGEKEVGLNLCSELVSFYQQIYGAVHAETADFYSSLAQLYADNGMIPEACIMSRKSIILNERVKGVDSFETANAYVKSSFYESLNKDPYNSMLLNLKVFDIWSSIYGENHPNNLNIFSNCSLILESLKLTTEAHGFYERAIKTSREINGELSDITAVLRFRYGVYFYHLSKFDESLAEFSSAAQSLAKLVGPEDHLTKECVKFMVAISRYIEYTKLQQQEKLKAVKKPKAVNGLKKAASTKPEKSKKGKKGNSPIAVDPEIASKSVDEILQFIEGNSKSKKGKGKH